MYDVTPGSESGSSSFQPLCADRALAQMIEEVRELAEQSRLLALNVAAESALCSPDAALDALARGTFDEAERLTRQVEQLLGQIHHAQAF